MFETEKAMAMQPRLLATDWSSRIHDKCRKELESVKRVTFVGTGSSYHCAQWAEWLSQISSKGRIPSRSIQTWDFLAGGWSNSATRSDLFVIVSHRGCKDLTAKALAQAHRAGARRLLVTGQNSPTGGHPSIFTSPQETSHAHTMSLIGAMAASSEIVSTLLSPIDSKKLARQRKQVASLLDLKTALFELPNTPVRRGIHFVGGGPLHAVAKELALKVREIAHIPAHAYNTEEILHGPLASVERGDQIILLSSRLKSANAWQKYLYEERLERCRKAAEAIGAIVLEPKIRAPHKKAFESVGIAWQAVPALYWGQLFCLQLAARLKINPDLNRFDEARYEEARRRIAKV